MRSRCGECFAVCGHGSARPIEPQKRKRHEGYEGNEAEQGNKAKRGKETADASEAERQRREDRERLESGERKQERARKLFADTAIARQAVSGHCVNANRTR